MDVFIFELVLIMMMVYVKVWSVHVDIQVLDHGGNILDCASIAAITALTHFR